MESSAALGGRGATAIANPHDWLAHRGHEKAHQTRNLPRQIIWRGERRHGHPTPGCRAHSKARNLVRAYLSGSNPVHDRVIRAFAQGCGAKLVDGWRYEPSDVAIVFGVRKERVPQSWARGDIIRKQEKNGGRVVVLETGYVRRGDGPEHYYAAGWGGLNGRADFRNSASPSDRWERLCIGLRPWRTGGSRIVVCGQVPWDASVQHHDHIGWCQMVCAQLGRRAGSNLVFKPHPLAACVNYGVRGCDISGAPLAHEMEDARCVVTFNSNAAVEAVIAGVPAISMDIGSMAWAVTGHSLDDVESPPMPDRAQWASDLAFSQWTPAEMAAGLAWEHLSR